MIPDYRFPGGFQITATKGQITWTQEGDTIAACLAWGAGMRGDGWTVSEPVPYVRRLPGDMTRLNDEGSGAA